MAHLFLIIGFVTRCVLEQTGLVAHIEPLASERPFAGELLGVSTDGARVYTQIYDQQSNTLICSWDAKTGRVLTRHMLYARTAKCHALSFGPDCVRVLLSDEHAALKVSVIDPDTGRVSRTGRTWPYPHQRSNVDPPTFAFSPDAKWLLRQDRSSTFYATDTGEALEIAPLDRIRPRSTSFGCDGRLFATCTANGAIRVYDLPTGKLRCDIANPALDQRVAAFTPDGNALVVWLLRWNGWALESIDLANKARRTVLEKQPAVGRVVFAPDGQSFAHVAQAGDWPEALPISDWQVRQWGTGKLLARVPAGRDHPDVVFSRDGKTLYVQVCADSWANYWVLPWDITNDQPAFVGAPPLGPIERFRFTREGKLLGLAGGYVYAWDPQAGSSDTPVRVPSGIDWRAGAVFGPNGGELEFVELGDVLVSWNFRTGVERRTKIPFRRTRSDPAACRWFLPEGKHLAGYTDGTLVVWNVTDGRESWRLTLPVEDRPYWPLGSTHNKPVAVDPNGRLSMSSGSDMGVAGRYQPPTSIVLVDAKPPLVEPVVCEFSQWIRSGLEFSPSGRILAIPGIRCERRPSEDWYARGMLTIWDVENRRRVGTFPLRYLARLSAVRFSPDGRSLAISFFPQGVVVVEAGTWQVRASFPALTRSDDLRLRPTRDYDALAWSPDSRLLAVAGPHNGLSIWDTTKLGGPVTECDGPAVEKAWAGLSSTDAKTGFQAARCLLAAGDRGTAFLRSKLAAVPTTDPKHINGLIVALGDDDFLTRENATADLSKLGRIAVPALRAEAKASTSPEAVRRMTDLLGALDRKMPAPDELRVIRAVEALEWMGTPDAIKVLEIWAAGAAGALLTTEARASLDRRKQ